METTKYREIVHLSVLQLLPPHLLGGLNVVLEVEVLKPLQVDHLATHPRPDGSKQRVWLEPIVPSLHMFLVIEGTVHIGSVDKGLNHLPLRTTPVFRVVIDIDTSSSPRVFWKVSRQH